MDCRLYVVWLHSDEHNLYYLYVVFSMAYMHVDGPLRTLVVTIPNISFRPH